MRVSRWSLAVLAVIACSACWLDFSKDQLHVEAGAETDGPVTDAGVPDGNPPMDGPADSAADAGKLPDARRGQAPGCRRGQRARSTNLNARRVGMHGGHPVFERPL